VSGREPEFAEFAPERLSTGSRRRLDPVVLIAAVVVAGVALAIAKPWSGATEPQAEVVASPAPVADAPPGSDPAAAAPIVGSAEPPIGWTEAELALHDHETWGIRTLVRDPEPGAAGPAMAGVAEVVERWQGLTADDMAIGSLDPAIVALGLTFPAEEAPLDVRIWRQADGGWEWLASDPLPDAPPDTFLFAPPRVAGGYLPAWPAGRYRLEWLRPDGIERWTVQVQTRSATGQAALAPLRPPDRTLPSPLTPDFAVERDQRLFAVSRGVAAGLPAVGTAPLDADATWRQVLATDPTATFDPVASAFLPEANGLGVLLPTDARGASGSIVALGPDGGPVDAQRSVGIRFGDDGRAPFVVFRAPGGGTWLPGVYRLDVSWTAADGLRQSSYHLESRPGPVLPAGS
jgi:hypothetical protein